MRNIFIVMVLFISMNLYSEEKTLCGDDNRIFSYDSKVGRVTKSHISGGGCTATMISKNCGVTAGHCKMILNYIEFNVPHSSANGLSGVVELEDLYAVDQSSIQSIDNHKSDWAVFKLLPNKKTGISAGEAQGFYDVDFKKPRKKDIVRITGYGLDRVDPIRNASQQTNTGKIISPDGGFFGSKMGYQVDTEAGNSGSAVILEKSQKIVGIHIAGGCTQNGRGSNKATPITKNSEFISAIKSCLNSDH